MFANTVDPLLADHPITPPSLPDKIRIYGDADIGIGERNEAKVAATMDHLCDMLSELTTAFDQVPGVRVGDSGARTLCYDMECRTEGFEGHPRLIVDGVLYDYDRDSKTRGRTIVAIECKHMAADLPREGATALVLGERVHDEPENLAERRVGEHLAIVKALTSRPPSGRRRPLFYCLLPFEHF